MHYLVAVSAHALDALLVVVLATLTFAPLVVAHHVLSTTVAHTTHNRRLCRLQISEARSGHGVGLLRVVPDVRQVPRADLRYSLRHYQRKGGRLRVVPHVRQVRRGDLRYHLLHYQRKGSRLRRCAVEMRRMCINLPWRDHGRSCGNLQGRRRHFRTGLQRHEVLRRVGS
jgi:hypothetical protein